MKINVFKFLTLYHVIFIAFSVVLVNVLRFLPIEYTPLMLKRQLQFSREGIPTIQYWKPLSEIPYDVVCTILKSEDDRFFQHKGVDVIELRDMYRSYKYGSTNLRGCSTISQQVAKNCFTFSTDTFFRKFMELYWTSLIEIFWSKERILEVYLNVVEVGWGLYGIEAASQEYFHCSAQYMTLHDAATLAVCLPSPLVLTPLNVWEKKSTQVERLIAKLKYTK